MRSQEEIMQVIQKLDKADMSKASSYGLDVDTFRMVRNHVTGVLRWVLEEQKDVPMLSTLERFHLIDK